MSSSVMPREAEFILCGQRDGHLIRALRNLGEVSTLPQTESAPSLVKLRPDQPVELAHSISMLGLPFEIFVGGPVADRLAHLLPTLQEWASSLQELPGLLPQSFDKLRFDGVDFVETPLADESGFYQLWPIGHEKVQVERPRYTAYFDRDTEKWRRGDWYGLRFLAYSVTGIRCVVTYDPELQQLAVRYSQRWPELYERALVLASGQLPRLNHGWLYYVGIGRSMLDSLRSKLNFQLEES
jgi:hypothetical protein